MRASVVTWIILVVVLALIVASVKLQLSQDSRLWGEVQNAAHMPYFGVLALALLIFSRRALRSRINNQYYHYMIALLGAGFIGLAGEVFQIVGPRDADVVDLLRDLAGAVSFLGLYMVFDPVMKAGRTRWPKAGRKAIVATAVLIWAVVVSPVAVWAGATAWRNAEFPKICTFESWWPMRFVGTRGSTLRIVPAPRGWAEAEGSKVGQLTFRSGRYPGLFIYEPFPDWRGYHALRIEVFSAKDTPREVTVRIEDSQHNDEYSDRYTGRFIIDPGANSIEIPLADIESAPQTRKLDLASIKEIRLHMRLLTDTVTLYIDNIRLE